MSGLLSESTWEAVAEVLTLLALGGLLVMAAVLVFVFVRMVLGHARKARWW